VLHVTALSHSNSAAYFRCCMWPPCHTVTVLHISGAACDHLVSQLQCCIFQVLHVTAPSSSFTPDITPIILAGHRDNYEIIKILLDRGFRIPKPHDVRCNCKICVEQSSEDSLRHSRSRINAYRALASPSLIALSSKDPILTSFELSWELKRLSKLENEFKLDYEKLAMKCQEFAVDLLEQTRGSKELEVVLNHDSACPNDQDLPTSENKMKLSRLKLAIKYKQKKVSLNLSASN